MRFAPFLSQAGPRARCWLHEEDFAHDGHDSRTEAAELLNVNRRTS